MDETITTLCSLDFPLAVVDDRGAILGVTRLARPLLPTRSDGARAPLTAYLASGPDSCAAWLDAARQGITERLMLGRGQPSALYLITAQGLGPGPDGRERWALQFHARETPMRRRHEREVMRRITSVPTSTLIQEMEPLRPERHSAPITGDMLHMIMRHLGGACTLLFRAQEHGPPALAGQAGLPPRELNRLLGALECEAPGLYEPEGPLGEAISAGLVYTLQGADQHSGLLALVHEHLPFHGAETWVDGIGGFGAAVTCFARPPDPEERPFSTEAFVRLGRHLESATYGRSMLDAYRELQRTQERIIHTGKMAALGEMASGITHELRQPVTAINNFLSTIFNLLEGQRYDRLHQRLEGYRERSRRNIERLTGIIDHLRTFSRQDAFRLRRTDLPSLFEEIYLTFFNSQLLDRQIEVEWAVDAHLPPVEIDPQRIEQVILNLVSNARDALEGRPAPCITIGAQRLDAERVYLFVQDNGPGVSEAVRDRILEPFFSTKPVGKGTGIGLSISHGIVEGHHGELTFANLPEGGTRFSVLLPVKQPRTARPATARPLFGEPPARTEAPPPSGRHS